MDDSSMSDSILPFLPPLENFPAGSFRWPPQLVYPLTLLSRGAQFSRVDCGERLCHHIIDMQQQIGLTSLSSGAVKGLCFFLDQLMTRADAQEFYESVLPAMANLVLRLPLLLESHMKQTERSFCQENCNYDKLMNNSVNLRVLYSQQAGLVVLDQEFVAALLACSFFCLYPLRGRRKAHLPYINFDQFFGGINGKGKSQQQKMACIMHYFCRISRKIPEGKVSYERKVLPQPNSHFSSFAICEPDHSFWSGSDALLCPFMVFEKGTIEDERSEALEVDFANKFLGGGFLFHGCVQEEIRFCINPELIVGMLFLPAMAKNEAIEIVGAERFSCYKGYGSSFTFAGDYVDTRHKDSWGRILRTIIAIDASKQPGQYQFHHSQMLRETNKAFCGFLDHSKCQGYFQDMDLSAQTRCIYGTKVAEPAKSGQLFQFQENMDIETVHRKELFTSKQVNVTENSRKYVILARDYELLLPLKGTENQRNRRSMITSSSGQSNAMRTFPGQGRFMHRGMVHNISRISKFGIATGNWGCGAFGGDFELKSLLQWIAASQAGRPFVHYYTFGDHRTQKLQHLTEWILKQGWNVGDCWDLLMEYGEKRVNKRVNKGLFDWILPQSIQDESSSCLENLGNRVTCC
eukprot:c28133_g2_i1 orf=224-2122(+)